MADDCPAALVDFAGRLADASGVVIKRHFRTRVEVERKTDETPVTIADRESETAMRRLINETHPDHGIIGEEQGAERKDAALVWVLDPIDGTRAFIAGKPIFGTLIALVRDGIPILGVIDCPALGERWIGSAGRHTTFNGEEIEVRRCGALIDAVLNTTSPDLFTGNDAASFARLSGAVAHTQYGGDCYGYGLLASGFMDLVAEADLKPHDFCALVPVVEGAGGTITDWQGGALSLSSDGRVIAAGDPALHARALEVLAAD
jgi:histidinol phosphatase-like enzyme (inositol monophosphatase family)